SLSPSTDTQKTALKMKIIISLTIAVVLISTCQGYNGLSETIQCYDDIQTANNLQEQIREIYRNKESFCEGVGGYNDCKVVKELRELHNEYKEVLENVQKLLVASMIG
ncbi:unnamed protein product, partial [Owenia fusiformis]